MNTRRDFLKTSGFGLVAGTILSSGSTATAAEPAASRTAANSDILLGVASYSLRKLKLEPSLAIVQRLGIKRMVLKSFHLPLEASDDQIKQTISAAKAKGIEVYGAGTITMKTEADVEQAFHYGNVAGMQLLVCAPEVAVLPLLERKVKATGILAAIHNHGPDNPLYPSPLDAYALIKNLDKRVGLCVDIGHTQRLGQDPTAVFEKVFDRVFDVHIKDVSGPTKAGITLEIGRGIIDIPRFLRKVVALKYRYTLGFEFEKDENDPVPGLSESVGFVRGVLRTLRA